MITLHQSERKRLCDFLAAGSACGRIVQITGQPWIGKTQLLTELCTRAQDQGYTIALGRVATSRSSFPFEAFIDALEDHVVQHDNSRQPQDSDPFLAVARRFLSSGGETHQPPTTPAGQYRLFRSIRHLLERLAGTSGLVVALDDFHRADDRSMSLLAYLARHPPAASVVLAVAYRSSPAGRRLDNIVGRSRPGGAVYLGLTPLAPREAGTLFPAGTSAAQRQLMRRDAHNNPGAILSLMTACATTSDSDEDCASADFDDGPPPWVENTGLLDLGALSSVARRTLRAAAVSGDPFDPRIVMAIAQLPEEAVLAGLDELQDEDLITSSESGGYFRFQHPVGRAVAYHSANAGWRYGANNRAATVLRSRGAPATALARHVEHLAPDDAAVRKLLLEGARDTLCVRPGQARRWLSRVLDSPGEDSVEASLLLAKANAMLGHLAESIRIYQANWEHLGAVPLAVRTDAVEWRVRAHRLMGQDGEAGQILKEEVRERPAPVPHILEQVAVALESGDPWPRTAEWKLLSTVRDCDSVLRSQALSLLALVRLAQERVGGAAEAATECATLVDSLDDELLAGHMETLRWLGMAEARLGRTDDGLRHLHRALRFVIDHGQGYLQPFLALALADLYSELADFDSARSHREYAEAALLRSGSEHARPAVLWLESENERGTPVQPPAGSAPQVEASPSRQPGNPPKLGIPPDQASAQQTCFVVTSPAPADDNAAPGPEQPAFQHLLLLSRREREVAGLVSIGCTNQQIAHRLKLSQKTVETYLSRIFQKLNICSRAQIAYTVGQAEFAV